MSFSKDTAPSHSQRVQRESCPAGPDTAHRMSNEVSSAIPSGDYEEPGNCSSELRCDALTSEAVSGLVRFGEPVREAPPRSILIVEDAPDLADHLVRHLKEVAREVSVCSDGHAALEQVRRHEPALIVLDIGLPGMTGLDVCRALRTEGFATPILMLSGRAGELDRIVRLEFGADDYLVKPFGMLELLARVRALLRRAEMRKCGVAAAPSGRISAAGFVIDPLARQVLRDGQVVPLTEKEFDLFHLFASNPGRVYTRSQLLDLVWGFGSGVYEYTVTTHINRLRRKIEADPAHPRIIQTVWGLGYRLNAHAG